MLAEADFQEAAHHLPADGMQFYLVLVFSFLLRLCTQLFLPLLSHHHLTARVILPPVSPIQQERAMHRQMRTYLSVTTK